VNIRSYIGIAAVAVGAVTLPIGWMFSVAITLGALLLLIVGLYIFLTPPVIEKLEQDERRDRRKQSGVEIPGDIHGFSGWGRGGRSASWNDSIGNIDSEGGD
jgi:membrane protein implicated in regulation of membrane protease activity